MFDKLVQSEFQGFKIFLGLEKILNFYIIYHFKEKNFLNLTVKLDLNLDEILDEKLAEMFV